MKRAIAADGTVETSVHGGAGTPHRAADADPPARLLGGPVEHHPALGGVLPAGRDEERAARGRN
ncbi:hypothetical protein [Streptomyces sulfonofaciens]|uniref:hypothetical protein n=1 Tax=Streptomyces sulfonofaciens TaxID=68272 RepID=UPI00167B12CD|nr:hypothetical protein [Streptomyces sulfonofaciens]